MNTSFYTKNIKGLNPEMYLNFIQGRFYKSVHLTGTFNRRNYERVAKIEFRFTTHTHTHTHHTHTHFGKY